MLPIEPCSALIPRGDRRECLDGCGRLEPTWRNQASLSQVHEWFGPVLHDALQMRPNVRIQCLLRAEPHRADHDAAAGAPVPGARLIAVPAAIAVMAVPMPVRVRMSMAVPVVPVGAMMSMPRVPMMPVPGVPMPVVTDLDRLDQGVADRRCR